MTTETKKIKLSQNIQRARRQELNHKEKVDVGEESKGRNREM